MAASLNIPDGGREEWPYLWALCNSHLLFFVRFAWFSIIVLGMSSSEA